METCLTYPPVPAAPQKQPAANAAPAEAAPAAAPQPPSQQPPQQPPQPQRPSEPPFLDDPAIQSTIQHHRPGAEPPAALDLDDILRWDIDNLPLDAVVGGAPGASIGFSRWFRRQSPPPPQQTAAAAAAAAPQPEPAAGAGAAAGGGGAPERRSSLQDELVGNILNGESVRRVMLRILLQGH